MNPTTPAVFSFQEHPVRTIVNDGENWFVAKDIMESLDYAASSNVSRVISHIPEEWKGVNQFHTPGGVQNLITLSEAGMYFFLGRSDKPKALPFQKWLAGEVLPQLRKTGEYRVEYTASPNDVLTASQAEQLRIALKEKCDKLPKEKQGPFMMQGWSKLKSHFGCPYRKIPQRELTEALSIIGRHAAEWELVDEEKPKFEIPQFKARAADDVEDAIDFRAMQLAHGMYKQFVADMHEPSQYHYFLKGTNAPESWRPSSGASTAIGSMEMAAQMLLKMADQARASEQKLQAALGVADMRKAA